jgi:Ca2+-binding RTX toxin-like protein
MASLYFHNLPDGSETPFTAGIDVLIFSDPALSASQVDFQWSDDGRSVWLSVADKAVQLSGVTPFFLLSDGFRFADGSRLQLLTDAAQGQLVGTGGADLLVGSTAAHETPSLVDVNEAGTQGAFNGGILHGSSADGRYVLFTSSSNDLVAGDTNASSNDVFLRDTLMGTTTRVTVQTDGAQLPSNGSVFGEGTAAVSADGRTVMFTHFTDAFGGTPNTFDVFAKDMVTGAVTVVSSSSFGGNAGASATATSMSGSGRFVAFNTSSTALGPTDANGFTDVYLKDLKTGAVQRVSLFFGIEGDGGSTDGQVSQDGRFVAFTSTASNSGFTDPNASSSDVFLRDVSTGGMILVSRSLSSGGTSGNDSSFVADISGDGRSVLFRSDASDLIAGDLNGARGLFLRNASGVVVAVDTTAEGLQANASVGSATALSSDARYAVFSSQATNLVSGAVAGQAYVKDLVTGAIALLSAAGDGLFSSTISEISISDDGSQIFVSANGRSLDPLFPVTGVASHIYKIANPLLGITLTGGAGNDSYQIQRAADAVVELAGGGVDTVRASVSYALGANLENLTLTGAAHSNATGNSAANVLMGNVGDNVLDGGAGVDTVSYANALAAISVALDQDGVAQDTGGMGLDTLVAIENLTGSVFDDFLVGNDGANVLDGGLGVDVMVGGAGNDSYRLDSALDQVFEDAAGGTDTLFTAFSFTLTAELENLTLTGSANLNATGNSLNNVLTGNSGSNRLNGGAGFDTASYATAISGVTVGLDKAGPQSTGAGIDTLIGIENLTGSNRNDVLHGNAAANVLNGGAGIDTVSYARAAAAVTVSLALATAQATGGGGNDTLLNFENLTGSAFADTLTGSSGNNVLDGGAGADTLSGGDGNDSYTVGVGDTVVELAAQGTDTVFSSVSHTLALNVENLVLTGSANVNGVGNTGNNLLTGNSGANILNGGAGLDTASYAAAASAVTVNLTTGSALGGGGSDTLIGIESLIGSAFGDTLIGSATANVLNGGAGADTLTGGAGADAFVLGVRDAIDTITDFVSGSDKVRISMSGIAVGNGNAVVDSAQSVAGPGGFATSAELVIVSGNAASLSTTDASAAIGFASSNYLAGDRRLFVVDNGVDTGIYHFTSSATSSTVSPFELQLIATLVGVNATTLADFVFLA